MHRSSASRLSAQEKTHRRGIKAKRKQAGWDNDYLAHIIIADQGQDLDAPALIGACAEMRLRKNHGIIILSKGLPPTTSDKEIERPMFRGGAASAPAFDYRSEVQRYGG